MFIVSSDKVYKARAGYCKECGSIYDDILERRGRRRKFCSRRCAVRYTVRAFKARQAESLP